MKELKLYNTAHPLADTGKPIFIPFGEWKYDSTRRQRLDRAHDERIANELNARVARGEPGIPVYQGHPDVPELASKYPDKGALGWVTKIELVNEFESGGVMSGGVDSPTHPLPVRASPSRSNGTAIPARASSGSRHTGSPMNATATASPTSYRRFRASDS